MTRIPGLPDLLWFGLEAYLAYLAYVLLYPSALVVWRHRRLLRRWIWMTTRHPFLMLESAHEVRQEGGA